ncbi:phage head closure protein [Sphingomonas sp. RT2P30]
MRQRVDIQAASQVSDGAGGELKSWANIASSVAAEIIPLTGGEAFRHGVANNTQFYRVTMHHRDGVTPANRLVWNGTLLNIRTCGDPENRRRNLVMTAESGAGEP